MGKPAVPIISGRFEGDAVASSRAFGMPALRFVVVPRIYRNLSPAESISNTEPAFDDLVGMLTADADRARSTIVRRSRPTALRARTVLTRSSA